MLFQQHLRRERETRGWSQSRMAQELGTTPNTISAWERGISLPSPYFREKLHALLGKNALELGLLEEGRNCAEAVVEQTPNAQPATASVGSIPPGPAQQTPPVQGISEQVHTTSGVLLQSRQQVSIFEKTAHHPLLQYNARTTPWSRWSVGKRLLALAIVCASVLSILGTTVLFTLQHGITTPDPYAPYKGNLILNDPLTDQNSRVNWQEGWNANHASCQFKEGTYHAFQPRQGYFHACIAQLTDFRNFAYEVEVIPLQGDYAGILFRAVNSIDSHYYLFRVNTNGFYMLKRYIDGTDASALVMDSGLAQTYHSGYGQRNRLAVVADDNHLTLYINGQNLVTVEDTSYMQGQIGVVAGSEQQTPAEASFSNVRVWVW